MIAEGAPVWVGVWSGAWCRWRIWLVQGSLGTPPGHSDGSAKGHGVGVGVGLGLGVGVGEGDGVRVPQGFRSIVWHMKGSTSYGYSKHSNAPKVAT